MGESMLIDEDLQENESLENMLVKLQELQEEY
jgi:hypothetical protein